MSRDTPVYIFNTGRMNQVKVAETGQRQDPQQLGGVLDLLRVQLHHFK